MHAWAEYIFNEHLGDVEHSVRDRARVVCERFYRPEWLTAQPAPMDSGIEIQWLCHGTLISAFVFSEDHADEEESILIVEDGGSVHYALDGRYETWDHALIESVMADLAQYVVESKRRQPPEAA